MRIGFIGLGQMGRAMAHRLLDAGHDLVLWNRTAAAVDPLIALGAQRAQDPAAALATEIVISMLGDDAAVRAVWIDSSLVDRSGVTHLNMASVSLGLARALAARHRHASSSYVAAPVFGRPEFAARGELDIVAAGPADALERCAPIFATLGRRWFNAGHEAHLANVVKIARNLVLATIIESLGEAFALVRACGGSAETFLDIITSTSMSAPAYRDYGRRILQPATDPTFPLHLGLKDVELAIAAARDCALDLPSAAMIRDHHRAAIAAGYGDKDWADLGNWIIAHARGRDPATDALRN